MGHLPLYTFRGCVRRYPAKYSTRTFSHLDQFLTMTFAHLTYRESLRDIEICLRAHQTKLYHLGIRAMSPKARWPMPTNGAIGALMKFLNSMSKGWNISLFHYRNHGTDYGRVLVGIQVPPQDKPAFQVFLDKLGYAYWDESKNPAYKLFPD